VKDGKLFYNPEDEVARGAVITNEGNLLWPNPNPPKLDAPKAKKEVAAVKEVVVDPFNQTLRSSLMLAAGLSSIVGLGVLCPDPAFMTMVSTFSLAVIAGY
jgi:NAD(P) transhydrogenase